LKIVRDRQVGEHLAKFGHGSNDGLPRERRFCTRSEGAGRASTEVPLEFLDGRLLKDALAEGADVAGEGSSATEPRIPQPSLIGRLRGSSQAARQHQRQYNTHMKMDSSA
jgi:hypothetical protein